MARRRRRSSNETRERDTFDIANRRLFSDDNYNYPRTKAPRPPFELSLEDRRFWHPEADYRPALVSPGKRARVVETFSPSVPVVSSESWARAVPGKPSPSSRPRGGPTFGRPPRAQFQFVNPDRVAVCVRRERRREVMFAKKLTRKGAGGAKRRNWWSDVKC